MAVVHCKVLIIMLMLITLIMMMLMTMTKMTIMVVMRMMMVMMTVLMIMIHYHHKYDDSPGGKRPNRVDDLRIPASQKALQVSPDLEDFHSNRVVTIIDGLNVQ